MLFDLKNYCIYDAYFGFWSSNLSCVNETKLEISVKQLLYVIYYAWVLVSKNSNRQQAGNFSLDSLINAATSSGTKYQLIDKLKL